MINAQLTSLAPTPMARRIGRVPEDQVSSGQRSTAPTSPPLSNPTAMNQMVVGTSISAAHSPT
jgi:hypothetical protein